MMGSNDFNLQINIWFCNLKYMPDPKPAPNSSRKFSKKKQIRIR